MSIYSITQGGLIEGGSLTGKHTVTLNSNSITVEDSGGVFTGYSREIYNYSDLKMTVVHFGSHNVSELQISSIHNKLKLKVPIDLIDLFNVFQRLSYQNFFFEPKLDMDFEYYAMIDIHGISLGKVSVSKNELMLNIESETIKFFFDEIKEILKISQKRYILVMDKFDRIEIIFGESFRNNPIDYIIEIKKIEKERFKNRDNLLNFKTIDDKRYYGYIANGFLEMYVVGNLNYEHKFDLNQLTVYLGQSKVVIKDDKVTKIFNNSIAREFCSKTNIIPKKLIEFEGPNYLSLNKHSMKLADLIAWYDSDKFILFNIDDNQVQLKCLNFLVKQSEQDSRCIVLPEGILFVKRPQDNFGKVQTPNIVFSEAGFPYYFKVLGQQLSVFLPKKTVYEGNNQEFYNLNTKKINDMVVIQLAKGIEIVLSIDDYKKVFKETIYSQKAPLISQLHTEKLLVSRARNLSDLLLFEFFGQWQIIVDYVSKQMNKEKFTEEEITHFGLYIYHATFQQRKRMEEISNKFPQFMNALTNELMLNPKLNQIHQKQQMETFQLTAQLKSQFTEIENLLSQITYIHFNNDEYQSRIKAAQDEAVIKKITASSIAGVGVAVFTGGIGLILPLMTLASEWSNRSTRQLMDGIQREKEYKKNEFYFKKAIELILHMDKHTLNYYVQRMNQLTYHNLRAEAEVLVSDNKKQYKNEILKQSLSVYTKVSLPIDYDSQLKPSDVVGDILTINSPSNESIKLQFIE